MAMTKRAKSGQIEQMINNEGKETTLKDLNMEWSQVVIKDVLDVPTQSPHSIDVDLDAEDENEIAVKA